MTKRSKFLILVIDDEEDIRSSLRMILEYEGMEMVEAASGPEGLERAASYDPDVVLLDIKMPRMDGLEVLSTLVERETRAPVVMISGHGTISTAVEATRLGAFDFMEKPLERDRVLLVIRNALGKLRLQQENRQFRHSHEERFRMVGQSPALKQVQDAISRAAPTRAAVLITGESGSGKELVARAIHRASTRSEEPFIRVNCAAIPEELIESELFGHVKGSFTGAVKDQTGKFVQADGGTIFLDEIADMSLKTQSKVLRVLQDGEAEPVGAAKSLIVDVRVIAATNKHLPEEIGEGRFREDLYFRLNVIPIVVPPLRERREDIEMLIAWFLESFCRENNCKLKQFSTEALELFRNLPWQGNIRELRNAVERLLIMTLGETIEASDIPAGLGASLGTRAEAPAGTMLVAEAGLSLQEFKETAERAFLEARLEENGGNVAATAKAIKTPRSNLYKKLEAYGLQRNRSGGA